MLLSYQSNLFGNIYYSLPYVAAMMSLHGKKDKRSRHFLTAKMNFSKGKPIPGEIAADIRACIAEINTDDFDVFVIPSSSCKTSFMQNVTGNLSAVRITEVLQRKNNHSMNMDTNEIMQSLQINHSKNSNTCILVDDIITTGKTMSAFISILNSLFHYDRIIIYCYGLSINFSKHDISTSATIESPGSSMGSGLSKSKKQQKTVAVEDNSFALAKHARNVRSVSLSRKVQGIYRRAFSETNLLDISDEFNQGYSYNYITGGDIDALSFLKLIIRKQNIDYLLFSTWCMALEDIYQLNDWLDSGKIKKFDAYVGEIFPGSYKAEYQLLKQVIAKCGGRIGVFKNHSKIFAGYGDKFHFGIQTSANINTNPRTENACIQIGVDIYEFYKQFFDNIVSYE